jgi:thioredoxin reductase (NADPH)
MHIGKQWRRWSLATPRSFDLDAGQCESMATDTDVAAFPRLTHDELEIVRTFADEVAFEDGDIVFHAGDPEIDFHVVESGALEIVNTADGDSHVITHEPGGFAGDIDVLTGRPVIVTAIAQGPTRLLRIPRAKLRDMLNRIPALSEKLIVAFMRRRELLTQFDMIGLRVIGSGHCRDTNLVREFLHKNFMPFTWLTPESEEGSKRVKAAGSPNKWPVVECMDGTVLVNPTLHDLAQAAGIWRGCRAPCMQPQKDFRPWCSIVSAPADKSVDRRGSRTSSGFRQD